MTYHSHPHHFGFVPNTANTSLIDTSSIQSNHSSLFNQTASNANNSDCHSNASLAMSNPSNSSALQHSQLHQMSNTNSTGNNLTSGLSNNDLNNSNVSAAAAIAGYYNNLTSHNSHFSTATSSLQSHYPLFNPMINNSINANSTTPGSSFVHQYQNQMTSNLNYQANSTNHLNNHLNNLNTLNNQQLSGTFHSNRYNVAANTMPVSATSMLMNGRLMFNDLNGTNSVGGSNSTCSNSTINSLEETIIKKPTGKFFLNPKEIEKNEFSE